MINRLCKRLNQNIEVRQSLSSLRQEIKDSSKENFCCLGSMMVIWTYPYF